MDGSAAVAAEKIQRRIGELSELRERLRRGDPVTAGDAAAQIVNAVTSAERAEAAAVAAAEASLRAAAHHERLAEMTAARDPERAQKHRDQAAAARQHADDELAEAALDHVIADLRREVRLVRPVGT
jgi:hypothetical protein